MFASSLLMPEGGICQLIPEMEIKNQNISMATVLKLEHLFFRFPVPSLLYRLQNIGLITESTRSQLAEIKVKYSAKCFGI